MLCQQFLEINFYASDVCSHYAQLCNGILPLTQGLGQATCKLLADYGCMQLQILQQMKICHLYHAVFGQLSLFWISERCQ